LALNEPFGPPKHFPHLVLSVSIKIVYMLTLLLSTQYTKTPRVSKNEHLFVAINQNGN
jgi:hypothetical protein